MSEEAIHMKKEKVIFQEKIKCPHCKKRLIIKKTRKILQAGIPAETEDKITAEKDSQKTLNEVKA